MRLRDTRMYCGFKDKRCPSILRESCWREATFEALAAVSISCAVTDGYFTHLAFPIFGALRWWTLISNLVVTMEIV